LPGGHNTFRGKAGSPPAGRRRQDCPCEARSKTERRLPAVFFSSDSGEAWGTQGGGSSGQAQRRPEARSPQGPSEGLRSARARSNLPLLRRGNDPLSGNFLISVKKPCLPVRTLMSCYSTSETESSRLNRVGSPSCRLPFRPLKKEKPDPLNSREREASGSGCLWRLQTVVGL
jgi:hypothetical protein